MSQFIFTITPCIYTKKNNDTNKYYVVYYITISENLRRKLNRIYQNPLTSFGSALVFKLFRGDVKGDRDGPFPNFIQKLGLKMP